MRKIITTIGLVLVALISTAQYSPAHKIYSNLNVYGNQYIKDTVKAVYVKGDTLIGFYDIGYTSYVANLTQTGESSPAATVLSNTTGYTVTYTRVAAGQYIMTFSDYLNPKKTTIFTGSSPQGDAYFNAWINTSNKTQILIKSVGVAQLKDDVLNNSAIEIRIYP